LAAFGCRSIARIHGARVVPRAGGAPLHPSGLGSRMTTPPLERWSEDEALRELARLARDLPDVDASGAWRRLGRLTAEQRQLLYRALDALRWGARS
jgi:hypothetical protein